MYRARRHVSEHRLRSNAQSRFAIARLVAALLFSILCLPAALPGQDAAPGPAIAAAAQQQPAQQQRPSRPPGRVHLMLEEELVAKMQGLRRVGHSAQKVGKEPVLSADQPSDGAGLKLGSVRHVDGRFRMWYWSTHPTDTLYTTLIGYATSDDVRSAGNLPAFPASHCCFPGTNASRGRRPKSKYFVVHVGAGVSTARRT